MRNGVQRYPLALICFDLGQPTTSRDRHSVQKFSQRPRDIWGFRGSKSIVCLDPKGYISTAQLGADNPFVVIKELQDIS